MVSMFFCLGRVTEGCKKRTFAMQQAYPEHLSGFIVNLLMHSYEICVIGLSEQKKGNCCWSFLVKKSDRLSNREIDVRTYATVMSVRNYIVRQTSSLKTMHKYFP